MPHTPRSIAIITLFLMVPMLSAQETVDPVYSGLPLSTWRDMLIDGNISGKHLDISQPDETLLEFREMGAFAIPTLKALLQHEQSTARLNAATAFKLMGPEARPAIPDLIKALGDPVPQVQVEACAALAAIGPEARSAIPILTKMLSMSKPYTGGAHWSWHVCEHASDSLVAFGDETVPILAQRIHDKDDVVRLAVVEGLAKFSAAEEASGTTGPVASSPISALIEALDDPQPHIQVAAAKALGKVGPRVKPAVPALMKHLSDSGQYMKGWFSTHVVEEVMARALLAIGPTEQDLPALIVRMQTKTKLPTNKYPNSGIPLVTPNTQFYVTLAIGTLGPKARPAEKALTAALDDETLDCAAAVSLLKIDPQHARARETILACLSRADYGIKDFPAVEMACRMRWNDEATLSALRKVIDDCEPNTRLLAECRLLDLQPDSIVIREAFSRDLADEEVLKGFDFDNPHECWPSVLHTIRESQVASKLTLLVAMKNLESEWTRERALMALEAAGAQAGKLVPQLNKELTHLPLGTRLNAAQLLGVFGPTSKAAVPQLIKTLRDTRPVVRAAAAKALGKIGVTDAPVIEGLTLCLKDDYATVRINVANGLTALGAPARSSLPALKDRLKDEFKPVRDAASRAITVLSQ